MFRKSTLLGGSALLTFMAIATAQPVFAQSGGLLGGDFSVSASVLSDYRFRGVSQTNNDVSAQGTIDYSVGTPVDGIDFFVGAFFSNINFTPDAGAPDDGSLEIDFYGGFSGTAGLVNWAVGATYFIYPDAAESLNQDFVEATLAFDTDIAPGVNLGINYAVSPEFFGETGVSHWIQGTAAYDLPFIPQLPVTFDASIGYQSIEDATDYLTWEVGLSAQVHENVSIGVRYIDTDETIIFEDEDVGDATVVGFITVSF